VRAVFGEKYPDPVRVVSIGATVAALLADPTNAKWRGASVEFCGGTHLPSSKEAHSFAIMSEGALSTGVRRITAVAGVAATAAIQTANNLAARMEQARTLQGAELNAEVSEIGQLMQSLSIAHSQKQILNTTMDALRDLAKAARRENEAATREATLARMQEMIAAHEQAATSNAFVAQLENADAPALLAALNMAKTKLPQTAILLAWSDAEEGKVSIVACVPTALITKGLKAGDWVKVAAQVCGGGGGGKPDMAMAGGTQPAGLDKALASVQAWGNERL